MEAERGAGGGVGLELNSEYGGGAGGKGIAAYGGGAGVVLHVSCRVVKYSPGMWLQPLQQ